MSYENIVSSVEGRVGIIRLNRPKALNALNFVTMMEVTSCAKAFDQNLDIGCIVIIGSEKAFAAGADIKEMADSSMSDMYRSNWFSTWDELTRVRKPIIAAVSGYALGGGCELAMMCDFILASETAKFGQPEINLGVLPGMGGSQRLTRAIGKSKAMEMCLTGRMMDATEALQSGLVARVIPTETFEQEVFHVAEIIAAKPNIAAQMVKETINAAYETTLSQGIVFERRVFHSVFATHDQKEGMAAFVEKRAPKFTNE